VKLGVHLRGFLSLFLALSWVTTAAFAEHASAKFPLCQPEKTPCCPQPANVPNGYCPACRLSVPVATKDTSEQKRSEAVSLTRYTRSDPPIPPIVASRREPPGTGLHHRRTVFDLKDDLRI
jgi:hypothetical protein